MEENKRTAMDVIEHHGILGMKWGVRRYQNKDGSYTSAGRKRYGLNEFERDAQKTLNDHKETLTKIGDMGSKIEEEADKLSSEYEKEFNNAKLDSKLKDEILENLYDELGDGCDDQDLFDMCLDDYVTFALNSQVNNKLKDKRQSYEKMQEEYWNNVHEVTKELMDKYGDADIIGSRTSFNNFVNNGQQAVNEFLGSKLGTSSVAYLSRHFDDYWVNDIDAHYEAEDRWKKEFSMDEYNKWAENHK